MNTIGNEGNGTQGARARFIATLEPVIGTHYRRPRGTTGSRPCVVPRGDASVAETCQVSSRRMTSLRIFVSSVQTEFAEERAVLYDYLRGGTLMRRFFDAFLFEEVPATDRG